MLLKRIKNSLTARIFIITSLLLISACTLTYGFIAWFMPLTYSNTLDKELEEDTQVLLEKLSKSTLEECGDLLNEFAIKNSGLAQIMDKYGNIVEVPSDFQVAVAEDFGSSGLGVSGEKSDDSVVTGYESEYSSISLSKGYPFHFADSDEEYTLAVAGGLRKINQAAEAMGRILPLLAVAVLTMSFIGSFIYSRSITRPIVSLSGISQKMSKLEFGWHCDEQRKDEIGTLGRSLNEMSERLSLALSELEEANRSLKADIDREREQERRRTEFFSAVSHELKTPITIIKGQLEGMLYQVGSYRDRDRYLARSLKVAGQMEDIVQELLMISRMETTGFEVHQKKIDFSELLRKTAAGYMELVEQSGLEFQADIEEKIELRADGGLIQKAVGNLLSNACRYSPQGAKLFVKLSKEEGEIRLDVENTGVFLEEGTEEHLFEPFYRGEQSRNRQTGGSGLGLYIVKTILDLHQASCQIKNTESGVIVRICFREREAVPPVCHTGIPN
ncbi:HAMP domain-containing sensor histidine kinase [Anaerolentibacter hominis]|uniref:sensor histidine kinase n=1 Tax=Anaerolentibacter hominis TaxID=3079009 RepID=UPI0031B87429